LGDDISEDNPAGIRVRPPFIVIGSIFVGVAINRLSPMNIPLDRLVGVVAGIFLIVASLVIVGWSFSFFARDEQDPDPMTPTESLTFDGPYARSRNPMYVAMFLFQPGVALCANNFWIATMTIFTLAAIHFAVVLREEAYLRETFGDKYVDYTTRVRRYF